MDIPGIKSNEEMAIDLVVSVINKAQEKLGVRQNLYQIAQSRNAMANAAVLSLACLRQPLAVTSEKFIRDAIEKKWRLTDTLAYHLEYLGGSQDEVSQYYYFEAIFSQPTVAYPVPQATASVFFRVEDKLINPPEMRAVPLMIFRLEGHHVDYDVRYSKPPADWILALLQMKIKFFSRVERITVF